MTLVFNGFSAFTSAFFGGGGSTATVSGGGLSWPSRSNTDCFLTILALLTEIKKIIALTINPQSYQEQNLTVKYIHD